MKGLLDIRLWFTYLSLPKSAGNLPISLPCFELMGPLAFINSFLKFFWDLFKDVAELISGLSWFEHVEKWSNYISYNLVFYAFFLKYCSKPNEPLLAPRTDLVTTLVSPVLLISFTSSFKIELSSLKTISGELIAPGIYVWWTVD